MRKTFPFLLITILATIFFSVGAAAQAKVKKVPDQVNPAVTCPGCPTDDDDDDDSGGGGGSGGGGATGTCGGLSYTTPVVSEGAGADNLHINGQHWFAGDAVALCSYTSFSPPKANCDTTEVASTGVIPTDTGAISEIVGVHQGRENTTTGTSSGVAGATSATTIGVGAWEYCLLAGCPFSIGVGPIVIPTGAIWSHTMSNTIACEAEHDPTY